MARGINKMLLLGNVGKIDVRYTADGQAIAKFTRRCGNPSSTPTLQSPQATQMQPLHVDEILKKTEKLTKPNCQVYLYYVWKKNQSFSEYRDELLTTIVYPSLRMAIPDTQMLTCFCQPEGIAALAIAPFAGVFLMFGATPKELFFCSRKLIKSECLEFIKETSQDGDLEPSQEFMRLYNIHKNYEKPDEKPDLDFFTINADEDQEIAAYIAYKHVEKYHCLPL